MKKSKTLAVLLLFVSSTSLASEMASQELQNLVYIPHKGQHLLTASYDTSFNDKSSSTSAAGAETDTDTDHQGVATQYFFGLSDATRLGFAINYLIRSDSTSRPAGSSVSTSESSSGISDPTLEIYRRVREATEVNNYTLDLGFEISPSLGHHKAAVSGVQDGDHLSGGWSSVLSFPMYWSFPVYEIGLTPQATYNFGDYTEGISAGTSTVYSSRWSESVTARLRYHTTTTYYLEPRLRYFFEKSVTDRNSNPGAVDHTRTTDAYVVPGLQFGYLMYPTALFTFDLSYSDVPSDRTNPNGKSSTGSTVQTLATVEGRFTY